MSEHGISGPLAAGLAVLAFLSASGRALAQNPSDAGNHPFVMARTPVQVANDWGLLGSWRTNCGAPASRDNITITYANVGGVLVYQRDYGATQDSNPVISASVTPDDKMDFVIDFTTQKRHNLVVKSPDGSQYHAVDNSDVATGEYSVKDGKFTGNGQIAPWQNRCK